MNRGSGEYVLYIRADDEDASSYLAAEIADATWRAGHFAHIFRRRHGTSETAQVENDIRQADIFVSVSQNISENVRKDSAWALANGRALLALVVGREIQRSGLEELKSMVDRSPEGSFVSHLGGMSSEMIVNEYLISLHKLIRVLDRRQMLLEAGFDPHIPNRFVRKFGARVLSMRCEQNPFLKKGIADFFYENNFPHLIQNGIRYLFLESGSSIAYVAETMAEGERAEWTLTKPHLEIEANNILAYLELASAKKVRVSLYPPGRPDDKYGATLGTLMWVQPERNGVVESEALGEMCKLKDYFKQRYKANGILLGATSGIDLGLEFPGFHTGSYPMMLFKRAMLEAAMASNIPLLIFADEDKIPYAYNPTKCYSVCDSDLPWETVCSEVPLAIACAFRSQERAQQVMPKLIDLGFAAGQQESDREIPWCVIAANEKFVSASKGWFRARPLTLSTVQRTAERQLIDSRVT